MKYTPSGLASEFSGSIGSTTAAHNRFGPYFRTRTIPTNPNTADQQTFRNVLKTASQAWKNLTEAQRSAWSEAAALIQRIDSLGRVYYQTGHQFFVSTCQAIKLYDSTSAFPTDPSTVVTPIDPTSFSATFTTGGATMDVVFADTPVPATTKLVIEATGLLSAGVNYVGRSKLRILQIFAAAQASPANIKAAYIARYGALTLGEKIGLRIYEISSTGGRTNKLSLITVIAT